MRRLTIGAAACALAAACGDGGGEGNAGQATQVGSAGGGNAAGAKGGRGQVASSILDTLSGTGEHKTLSDAVNSVGLTSTLSGPQPYTMFAPTDAAFSQLPEGGSTRLLEPEQKPQLTALLTGHIVPGTVTAADLDRAIERGKGKAQLATVGGTNLSFARSGDAILVTDAAGKQARITNADRAASNGVIHSVDAVLLPR